MIFCIFSFAREEIFADFEVYAKQSSKLAFESSGKVDKIFVDVSSHVKKGDTLASLDQTSLEIALKKAKNDLALAKNAKEFAKNTFNKFSQVKDVTSKQEFDEVKYKFDEAALRVESAQIAILNADDHLKKAVLKAVPCALYLLMGILVLRHLQLPRWILVWTAMSYIVALVTIYPPKTKMRKIVILLMLMAYGLVFLWLNLHHSLDVPSLQTMNDWVVFGSMIGIQILCGFILQMKKIKIT